ncbi:MAG: efflux RND transporter periplasmic adaptor subunit [bacterium]
MPQKILSITNTLKNIFKSKITIGIMAVIAFFVVVFFVFFNKPPIYKFIGVERGSIIESVSLTGNTTPAESVSLSFGSGGIISHTYSSLGKQVSKGQVLAELNMSDLIAQLHQAQAAYSIAETTYNKLVNGATSSDVEVAKVSLSNAKNAYDNTVAQQKVSVANALLAMLNSGLVATPTISGASVAGQPTISGTYNSALQGTYTINIYATGNGAYFSFSGLEGGSGQVSTVSVPLGSRGLYIHFPSNNVLSYENTSWTISIPNTQSSGYLSSYNAYQSALQNQTQALASAQGVVDSAQAALDQKLAGARTEDLTISQAQVIQAQASVESVNAKIQNAKIIAPISGTITIFDAKIGQLASPNAPLVSIMASDGYEVDAGVSEIDVGKILVGNKVTMTLDAFPNETFTGLVFYIAPAETNTQGVVSYKVKISFDKTDPRLKSGLTANIDIQTKQKDGVLILPQYAVLQNDQGTFVETLEKNKIVQNPIVLGIQDQKGNVEIVSGVTEGEQVLNIGLKVQ